MVVDLRFPGDIIIIKTLEQVQMFIRFLILALHLSLVCGDKQLYMHGTAPMPSWGSQTVVILKYLNIYKSNPCSLLKRGPTHKC